MPQPRQALVHALRKQHAHTLSANMPRPVYLAGLSVSLRVSYLPLASTLSRIVSPSWRVHRDRLRCAFGLAGTGCQHFLLGVRVPWLAHVSWPSPPHWVLDPLSFKGWQHNHVFLGTPNGVPKMTLKTSTPKCNAESALCSHIGGPGQTDSRQAEGAQSHVATPTSKQT